MLILHTRPRTLPSHYLRRGDQVALRPNGTHYREVEQLAGTPPVQVRWWSVASLDVVTDGALRTRVVEVGCAVPTDPHQTSQFLLCVRHPDDVVMREQIEGDPWDLAGRPDTAREPIPAR